MSKSKLGFFSILLLGLNTIIGSGIFLLPHEAMKIIGPASLLVFAFDIAIIGCISLCFAEVSSYFKRSGGAYIYAKEAFGDFFGFEIGVLKWFNSSVAWATLCVALVSTLEIVLPELHHQGSIILIMCALAGLNLMGVHLSKVFLNTITISKLIPLLLFISVGIFFTQPGNFTPFIPKNIDLIDAFTATALVVFYAFTGFESVVVAAEDMNNPKKNLPKAILWILLILALIYTFIQYLCISILGPNLAITTAPIASAAQRIAGPLGASCILAGMTLSIGGTNIAASFIAPRVGAALARDKMLPSFLNSRNKRNAPTWAIILTTLFSILLALSGNFVQLAMISAIASLAQYISTCIALPVLRKKMPGKSLFQAPGGMTMPIIASISCLAILSYTSADKLIWGLGSLLLGAPLYLLRRYWS